ncbi:MAG: hypothetical protein CL845_06020 [Crocinitomicaceae bacterium]|nr:hypothetical protein [Crocinitomicaceae bacterium]
MIRTLILLFTTLIVAQCFAQTEGNNVFGPDHILQVDIDFYSTSYWNELLSEYEGEQNYIPAAITIGTEIGTTTLDSVGIRLKGNSSMNHPGNKKPFKVDFNRFIPGQAYDLLKKLNFNNGFKDPTFAREKVFLDICEDAGILAPRATFAEVRYNGESWGFYTVVEQIDDQFLDRSIGDDDGMLFKAGSNFGPGSDEASLVYEGPNASDYGDAYDLKMNESDDWSDFISFIEFINTASDEQFENELGDHLDLQAYLRSAALDNLFANLDSYTLSARNYYLYQNTTLGRWQWIKWDCNETFGSYAFGVPGDMTQLDVEFDGGNYDRPLLERILANENLKNAYLAEVCELRELYFNSEYLDPRLDAVQALIQSAVYNDDNKMYSNADFAANFDNNLNTGGPGGGGGPGGALYGLHSFVADRSAFVANEVDCSGLGTSGLYDWPPFAVYPNPTDGRVTLAWNASGEHPTIELYDLSGQLAGIIKTGSRQTTHELNLPPGLYFLKPTKGVPSSAIVLQIIQ